MRRRGNEGHGTQERVVSLEVFRECVLGVREMIDLKSRGLLLAIRSDFSCGAKNIERAGHRDGIGGVVKIELPVVTIAEATRKIAAAKAARKARGWRRRLRRNEGSVSSDLNCPPKPAPGRNYECFLKVSKLAIFDLDCACASTWLSVICLAWIRTMTK